MDIIQLSLVVAAFGSLFIAVGFHHAGIVLLRDRPINIDRLTSLSRVSLTAYLLACSFVLMAFTYQRFEADDHDALLYVLIIFMPLLVGGMAFLALYPSDDDMEGKFRYYFQKDRASFYWLALFICITATWIIRLLKQLPKGG